MRPDAPADARNDERVAGCQTARLDRFERDADGRGDQRVRSSGDTAGQGYERFRWHSEHLRESAVAPVADIARKDDGAHAKERRRYALSDGADRARDLVAEHARERNAAPQRPLHDECVVVREAARFHAEDGFSRPWLRIRERGVAQTGRRARRFEYDGSHAHDSMPNKPAGNPVWSLLP